MAIRSQSGKRLSICIALTLAWAGARCAFAQGIDLAAPDEDEFILDRAGLIAEADAARIRAICGKLLADRAIPSVVVTIESMATHGAQTAWIRTFSMMLFNQWDAEFEAEDNAWGKGILLVVSEGDRKARVELGPEWEGRFKAASENIMDDYILPRFKKGEFSAGIAAGVEALDKMARGLPLPGRTRPLWHSVIGIGVAALVVLTAASLLHRGANGWAWACWGALFASLAHVLYRAKHDTVLIERNRRL